jgi:peroxiredoxin Q/BCP
VAAGGQADQGQLQLTANGADSANTGQLVSKGSLFDSLHFAARSRHRGGYSAVLTILENKLLTLEAQIALNLTVQGISMNFIRIASLAFMLTAFVGAGLASDDIPQVGQTAPNFTLPSQDGTPLTLNDLRGKWVVLYFYPKDNTPGCTIEAHNFERDLPKYKSDNAVIVGVSVDTTGSHKDFCAKQGLTFKLLADDQKKVVKEYGSTMGMAGMTLASRNTFLIDPQGKIVKVWVKVDPKTHSQDVIATLESLKAKGA